MVSLIIAFVILTPTAEAASVKNVCRSLPVGNANICYSLTYTGSGPYKMTHVSLYVSGNKAGTKRVRASFNVLNANGKSIWGNGMTTLGPGNGWSKGWRVGGTKFGRDARWTLHGSQIARCFKGLPIGSCGYYFEGPLP